MVYSETPCVAAGTFTTNVVKAAPVKWDQNVVYNYSTARGIVVNSGWQMPVPVRRAIATVCRLLRQRLSC